MTIIVRQMATCTIWIWSSSHTTYVFHMQREVDVRYIASLIQVIFLIGHLYLIGVWLRENKKNKHHEDNYLKEIELRPHIL